MGCLTQNNGIITHPNGHKEWYTNDKLHRLNGPAIIRSDGTEIWYKNGIRHDGKDKQKLFNITKRITNFIRKNH